ncbi:MAG TPA: energy transducer TonB [Lysobacter sp.]|nr:energy transducer TonB [Lysobacter sp.]
MSDWLPSHRAWLWMLLAFAIGVVLFVLVWSRSRQQHDFYRAGEAPPTSAAAEYTPLPVPSGDRSGETQGLDSPSTPGNESGLVEVEPPRVIETAPPPMPVSPPATPAPTVATTQPMPLAGRTPAPSYPARALRRGESGTVLVQAHIGPDGVPTSVTVAEGSGSRLLDRAAVDAVRRWRFQPALQDGRPTVGTVNIPIEFTPQR